MYLIRPIEKNDLEGFCQLADLATVGMTTIPRNRDVLSKRIEDSEIAFKRTIDKPSGESYQFVMEDLSNQTIIGCSGIFSKVGGYEPFYTYEIKNAIHKSETLKVDKKVPFLELKEVHDGPSEIGALFLSPNYRNQGQGRLLSLSRFLYMAEYPERFEKHILAELRGVIDENGHSSFWEALGRHFFDVDFSVADPLSVKDKQYIADLMPRHPIYIPLMPPEVQKVISGVHQNTQGALKLLQSENFQDIPEVDIFDAGKILSCETQNIRTIRDSKKVKVAKVESLADTLEDNLVSTSHSGFKATTGKVQLLKNSEAILDTNVAQALQVKLGQEIRCVALKPKKS